MPSEFSFTPVHVARQPLSQYLRRLTATDHLYQSIPSGGSTSIEINSAPSPIDEYLSSISLGFLLAVAVALTTVASDG